MRTGKLVLCVLAAAMLSVALGLSVLCCVPQPKEPLRLGVNAWPPFELLYLAQERGFFKDEGVEVDLCDFSSYTGILRAYHKGNIDGFLATLNEVMIADNFQDIPAVVLVADYSFGSDALIARDGIAGPASLRGRTIAFEESALGSYMLERVLESGGLRSSEVKVLNKLPEEGSQAFRSGQVDALITYQPDLGKLLREKGAHVVFSSREIPGEIVDVMALRKTALSDRAPEVRKLVNAWFRALKYLEDHPDESAATMAKRQGVSIDEFQEGIKGAHIPDLAENRQLFGSAQQPGPLHRSVSRLASFLIRHGLAKSTASAGDLFHPEIVDSD